MPCNCSHLSPTLHEEESRKVAEHLVWIHNRLKDLSEEELQKYKEVANNPHGNALAVHQLTSDLCKVLDDLSDGQKNKYIYDGRVPQSRNLYHWWESYQAAEIDQALIDKDQKDLEKINIEITQLVSGFLYYDRKEDEDLPVGLIEEAIKRGALSVDDIANKFRKELYASVY